MKKWQEMVHADVQSILHRNKNVRALNSLVEVYFDNHPDFQYYLSLDMEEEIEAFILNNYRFISEFTGHWETKDNVGEWYLID